MQIARKDSPAANNVRQRILADEEFHAKYACARDMGLDAMADELLDIADDGTNDWGYDDKGNPKPDIDHIKRSALRVDVRKWYLSKLAPKRYGDKLNVDANMSGSMTLTGFFAEAAAKRAKA